MGVVCVGVRRPAGVTPDRRGTRRVMIRIPSCHTHAITICGVFVSYGRWDVFLVVLLIYLFAMIP